MARPRGQIRRGRLTSAFWGVSSESGLSGHADIADVLALSREGGRGLRAHVRFPANFSHFVDLRSRPKPDIASVPEFVHAA